MLITVANMWMVLNLSSGRHLTRAFSNSVLPNSNNKENMMQRSTAILLLGLLASAIVALEVDEAIVPEVPPELVFSSEPIEMPAEQMLATPLVPNEVWSPLSPLSLARVSDVMRPFVFA